MRYRTLWMIMAAGLMVSSFVSAPAQGNLPAETTYDITRLANTDPPAALIELVKLGQTGNVEVMLKNHVYPHARDGKARTALHYAALNGQIHIAELLLDHHAELDVVDNDGKTPLHLAAEKGLDSMVKVLRRAGARNDIRDNAGLTARDYAVRSGGPMSLVIDTDPSNVSYPMFGPPFNSGLKLGIVALIPLLVLFTIVRLIVRGRRRKRSQASPTTLDQEKLRHLANIAERMEARIVNLETILNTPVMSGQGTGRE